MSIIDPKENRYAVIGVDNDGSEHWYLRWDLGSSEEEILEYHKAYLKFYNKIEIWIVDWQDEKIYSKPDWVYDNINLEDKPDWFIDFEKELE